MDCPETNFPNHHCVRSWPEIHSLDSMILNDLRLTQNVGHQFWFQIV